jgi:hypothetical protein
MCEVSGPTAVCPSCQKTACFHFIGNQHWPSDVAEAASLEPVIAIWRCNQCQSSLLETNLDFSSHKKCSDIPR